MSEQWIECRTYVERGVSEQWIQCRTYVERAVLVKGVEAGMMVEIRERKSLLQGQ